jgi:hypothetical protein
MTNPGNRRSSDHLDEQIANSFGSKESSSLKSLTQLRGFAGYEAAK